MKTFTSLASALIKSFGLIERFVLLIELAFKPLEILLNMAVIGTEDAQQDMMNERALKQAEADKVLAAAKRSPRPPRKPKAKVKTTGK